MNRFVSVVASSPNERLIAMVTHERDEFDPEAVAAAEQELRKRNVSWEQKAEEEDSIDISELPADFRLPSHEASEVPVNIEALRDAMRQSETGFSDLVDKQVVEEEKNNPESVQRWRTKAAKIGGIIALIALLLKVILRILMHS